MTRSGVPGRNPALVTPTPRRAVMSEREPGRPAPGDREAAAAPKNGRLLEVRFDLRPPTSTAPLVGQAIGEHDAATAAAVLLALADPMRLRLVSLIGSHPGGEACACELYGVFDPAEPSISRHLSALHEAGLIGREQRGPWEYFLFIPSVFDDVCALLGGPQAAERSTDSS